MLVTWSPKSETITVAFNFSVSSAVDAKTKQELAVTAGKLSVPLEGYGVRFIRRKLEQNIPMIKILLSFLILATPFYAQFVW